MSKNLLIAIFILVSAAFSQTPNKGTIVLPSGLQAFGQRRVGAILTTTKGEVQYTLLGTGERMIKDVRDHGTTFLAKRTTADLVIDVNAIDTNAFGGKYAYWAEVPVGTGAGYALLDANHNGRLEVYGGYHDYQTIGLGPNRIYEYASNGQFNNVYQFTDTLWGAGSSGDIDGDGLIDNLYYRDPGDFVFFSQATSNSLPTTPKLIYHFGGNTYGQVLADLDGDGKDELVYNIQGNHAGFGFDTWDYLFVEKYDSVAQSLRTMYYHRPQQDYTWGIAAGDFDSDGKMNFSNGGINGAVFVYEHVQADSFNVQLMDTVSTTNAYLAAFTNDLDGNGKPELWIGGDTYLNGVPTTRIYLYEAVGDNQYQRVYQIDIVGIFSFFAGNIVVADMDHDGKPEVLICLDENVFIIKCVGYRQYELWSRIQNELALAGMNSVVYAAAAADFDNDGYPEVLLSVDNVQGDANRAFSRIYKLQRTTGVTGPQAGQLPAEFKVGQNYPNPFNGQTVFEYSLPSMSRVVVRVYDILGKEVASLQDRTLQAGTYLVRWAGTGKDGIEVPSGVYLVRFQTERQTQTIKTILLK